MLTLLKPSRAQIDRFLASQEGRPFSYPEVGHTRDSPPAGYNVDHRRVKLGEGQAAFEAACAALRRWEMFRQGWVELCWPDAPIAVGTVVASLAWAGGVWWLNACRIVYVIDESSPSRRFGFAFGTLEDHAERGEERFMIEWGDDDEVWYDVLAFSRPRHWMARLGYPLARQAQKRFGLGAQAAMLAAVRDAVGERSAP
jgi:uncharacterized protein (UPF0548 family)